MIAKEIMNRDFSYVLSSDSACQALNILFSKNINILPVVDLENKLVGVFSESDVLRAMLPGYVEKIGEYTYEENPKFMQKKLAAFDSIQVKDIMRTDIISVSEDTKVYEIARTMLIQKLSCVIVVNQEKKILGVISRAEILKFFFRFYKD
ncbi:MAG: CBS domain-containing protein [Candidatus Omnitrophota bacterium]